LIETLRADNPFLHTEFLDDSRKAEGESHVMRNSGRFPLCGRGDINVYTIFAEGMRTLLSLVGRVGCVLPTGIATDETTKFFFQDLMGKKSLISIFDFENQGIFPGVHSSYKFCLFTASGVGSPAASVADFIFFAHTVEDISDPTRRFSLSVEDVLLLNPNTRTCPIFRSRHDAELTKRIYSVSTVLNSPSKHDSWNIDFLKKMLDFTIHRSIIGEQRELGNVTMIEKLIDMPTGRCRSIYEAKLIHQFDHRYASYPTVSNEGADTFEVDLELKKDASVFAAGRYWVREEDFKRRIVDRPINFEGILSLRGIARSTDERTLISAIRPLTPAFNSIGNAFVSTPQGALFLCGCLNSFVADYVTRQKLGGANLDPYVVFQLAVVRPDVAASKCQWSKGTIYNRWIAERVIELTYTAWDLEPFAMDCGWSGPPFRWVEERRFLLRCELDAAFFHLYLPAEANGDWRPAENETAEERARLKASFPTPRDAVDYVMDTFPIVKRKDEAQWNGDYRTKRVILEIYDAMADAARTGIPYQTRLDPPPADPRCCHPKKKIGILAFGSLVTDPGTELRSRIAMRIKTKSPFSVEYARISQTRGGAPTLVPHESGAPVSAEILVLDDDTSVAEATGMLWRRERRREGTGDTYSRGTADNSVLVEEFHDAPCVSTVLYTDFNPTGKNSYTAAELAKRAIRSVAAAPPGMDGITYLMNMIHSGIETPLTAAYKTEILKQTVTLTLEEALKTARETR
jgi:hypothetical protein